MTGNAQYLCKMEWRYSAPQLPNITCLWRNAKPTIKFSTFIVAQPEYLDKQAVPTLNVS